MSGNNTMLDTKSIKGVSMALLVVVSTVAGLPLLAGSAAAAGTTDVTADPSSATSLPNETQTFVITVPNASDGVGAYNFNFSVDSSVAKITAVSDLTGGSSDTAVSSDGSSANIRVFGASTADGSVDIIEVTVETVAPGSTSLDVTVNELADTTTSVASYTVQSVTDPSITVQDPVDFQVSNLSAPSSAETGESITVSATVQNDGVQQGTQTVEFRLGGSTVVSESVTLNSSESTTVTFNVTTPSSAETFTHGVFTDDDSATASLTVTAPSSLSVQPGSISPDAVDENKTVTHTLTFDVLEVADDGNTNTFTVIFPETVDLSPNSVSVVDEDGNMPAGGITGGPNVVDVANGSNNGIQFSVSPDSSQNVRNLTFTVDVDVTFPEVGSDTTVGIDARANDSSGDSDQAQVASVTINDTTQSPNPANFEVSNLTAPSSVEAGTEISVSATVTNTGGQQATETVQFRFDGSNITSQTVNLAPGKSTTVTFTTTPSSTGTVTHGVFTDNDSQTAQIELTSGTTRGVSVSLQPASLDLTVGQNATYDIVADNVPNGVTTFDVTVSSSDASVVEVLSGSPGGTPAFSETPVASDGSSVRLRAVYASSLSSDSTVTLGTVSVNGSALGSANLTLQVSELGDAGGNLYTISNVSDATADVNPQDAPDNLTLVEPSTPTEFDLSNNDKLQIAYEYDENQTGTATVQLTQNGQVAASTTVSESAYTDDGTVKSFGLDLTDSFDVRALNDGRYNVTLIVTNKQGGTATTSTSNAPVAINDNDVEPGDPQFNEGPTAEAAIDAENETVTVDVTYNISVPEVTDAGDLDQTQDDLDSVQIDATDIGTLTVEYYDAGSETYATGEIDIGAGVVAANATAGVSVEETITINLSEVETPVDPEDRVLDRSVALDSNAVSVSAVDTSDDSTARIDDVSGSATLSQQDAVEPRIESVEVVGADTPSTALEIEFTRPIEQVPSETLTHSDFAYQDVSGDGANFVTQVTDISGDTVTVTLEEAVTAGDVGADILSLQSGDVLESDTDGVTASSVGVSPDNETVEETTAPAISDVEVGGNATQVTVTFDQAVEAGDGGSLTAVNFTYIDANDADASGIESVEQVDSTTVVLTLNASATADDVSGDSIEVPAGEVFDQFGNSNDFALATGLDEEIEPSGVEIVAPTDQLIKQSDGTLQISYRYVENIPDGTDEVTITLDGPEERTFTIADEQYVGDGSLKTVAIDLAEDSELADGTYDVEVEVTDSASNTRTDIVSDVLVVNDDAPDVRDVSVNPASDVTPDETISVSYDYLNPGVNATSVTVHIVNSEDVNNFTSGDFPNARFAQVTKQVDDSSDSQTVEVDLSGLDAIQDNDDYTVFVTAVDESGLTNLNVNADPIIEGPVSSDTLDVNANEPTLESVETNAGSDTVTVSFSEPVVAADGEISLDDFAYQDVSGDDASASSIESVQQVGPQTVELTLDSEVTASDLGSDLVNVRQDAIEDTDGDNARQVSLNATALADTTAPTTEVSAEDVNAQNADNFQVDVTTEPLSEPTTITVTATGSDGETVSANASVTDDTTVALNVSALTDGEVTVSVEATDVAGNSGSQSTASTTVTKDTVAPTIESATTNAGTSTVDVTFSEPVTDVAANAFSITSPVHEVDSVSQQDATTVVLTLNRSVPPAAINVSGVQVSATGVSDSVGNDVTNEVTFTDVEAPSIAAVSAQRNSSTVTVTFTEVITGGGESQNLTAEDFEYADNSNTSVSGIVSVNKTGPQRAVLTVNGSFTPSDLAEDTVAVAPESVFDTVDNAATSNAVGLGFEASLDASSTNDTVTIRVVTAQNITDAVDSLQVTEQNSEFAELEGFELNDRLETSLNASEFTEVEPGVFETAIELPRDDTYTVSGVVSSTFQTETTTVDTSVPEPTDAVVLEVTSEAQLDDSRETTRLRVLFDEPIDASQISPDDVTVGGLDGEIVAVQDAGAFGAVEVIVEGDLQTGDSPEISIAGSSYTDLNGTQGVENGSTVIHTDVVQLNEGVNLVSVPAASGSLDISELPLDAIESISRYNAETDSFEVFVPGAPNNPFTTLDGGEGYIIRLENGTTASVAINVANEPTGEGGPNSVDLSEGLNLIGHYQEDQQAVTTALSSVTAGQDGQFSDTVFTVLSQDEEAGGFTYESFRAGEFSTMEDGEAYWVFVTEDETYTEAPFDDR